MIENRTLGPLKFELTMVCRKKTNDYIVRELTEQVALKKEQTLE